MSTLSATQSLVLTEQIQAQPARSHREIAFADPVVPHTRKRPCGL